MFGLRKRDSDVWTYFDNLDDGFNNKCLAFEAA